MPVDPSRRWKVISAVFALVAVCALLQRDDAGPARAAAASGRSAHIERSAGARKTSPVASTRDLVRRMLTARSAAEVRSLAKRLGVVGDDEAIDGVMPLLDDRRAGVPDAVLSAFAAIGSEHAIEILMSRAQDREFGARFAAIGALGEAGGERAEDVLVRIAMQLNDEGHLAAIDALGELGTDRAIETLERLAASTVEDVFLRAVAALAQNEAPAARAALVRLIDLPMVPVAVAALHELDTIDDALLAKLQTLISASDKRLVVAAIGALAHAGEAAVPLLVEAAFQGPRDSRVAAVAALAATRSEDAIAPLTTLLADGDSEVALSAGVALAGLDTSAAREALITAALSTNDHRGIARDNIFLMTGPDVERALVELAARDDDDAGVHRALQRLVMLGNRDAIDLAVARLHTGSEEQRTAALDLFGAATSQEATDALLSVARDRAAPHRARALELLADSRLGDPEIEAELRMALSDDDDYLARVAIDGLGKLGTDQARDALLGALERPEVSYRAVRALQDFRLTDAAGNALVAAAERDPELTESVTAQLLTAGHPGGLRLAERMLESESDHRTAIEALAATHSPDALELLERAARTPGHPARADALRSFGEMHDDRTFEVTRDALRDRDSEVRNAAASAMATAATPDARDALIELSRGGDPASRITAVEYLRNYGDDHAKARVRDLLRDGDPAVAIAAIESLRTTGGDYMLSALQAVLRDPSRPYAVRVHAGLMIRRYSSPDDDTLRWIEALEGSSPDAGGL